MQHALGTRPDTMILRVGDRVSVRTSRRAIVVAATTALCIVVIGVLTLTLGRLGTPLSDLLPAVMTEADGSAGLVLRRIRGPRLLVAIATGAAFGVSGALFQTVTRNPLGSPDVIGLGVGAGAGAAAFGLAWPGIVPLPVGALLGAFAALGLVWLGTGRGLSSPSRVILVGIGVSAMGLAFIQYLLARAGREQATVLSAYLNGSLSSRGWDDAAIIWVALAALLPLALLLGRRLELVQLGDEAADALGAQSRRTRAHSIVLAVALAAAGVSVAGPIAFVALTAPQIARRLSRSSGAGIVLSALTGALLLCAADLVVQHAPLAVQLPVGIVTAALGGVYLGYLLLTQWRRTT